MLQHSYGGLKALGHVLAIVSLCIWPLKAPLLGVLGIAFAVPLACCEGANFFACSLPCTSISFAESTSLQILIFLHLWSMMEENRNRTLLWTNLSHVSGTVLVEVHHPKRSQGPVGGGAGGDAVSIRGNPVRC